MSRKTNFILQAAGLALQIAPHVVPMIPPGNAVTIFHLALSFAQGALGLYVHQFNTDGTPQTTAFTEPPK